MKRFSTALAVLGFAAALLSGCNDYNNSIQNNTGASLINLSPSGVIAGNGDLLLTVNASQFNGFTDKSVIQWNGKKLPTTFVDITTLTTTVPASLLAKTGTGLVNTLTPQTGAGQNGLSNTLPFYIYSTTPFPVPTLSSISPNSAPACGTSCQNVSVTITVSGSNFLSSSNNGGTIVGFADKLTPMEQAKTLVISSLSDTEIKAVIPGTYLANSDTASVTVTNPANFPGGGQCPDATCVKLGGGGTSAALPFTIGTGAAPAIAEETPAISHDGRFVAYASQQNQVNQILLRDTCIGVSNGCTPATHVISASLDGTPGNADSHNAAVSADGRYVAFSSAATNLVTGAPTGRQIYLRDTCFGADNSCKPAVTLISTDLDGKLTGTESVLPSISTSGRFIAFVAITPSHSPAPPATAARTSSAAPNSGLRQVFVRDTCLGASECTPKTTRISMTPGDAPANGTKPAGPAVSGLAKQIALADGKDATVFSPTVPVDEKVFLAIPKAQ